jgi:hypothetical protein
VKEIRVFLKELIVCGEVYVNTVAFHIDRFHVCGFSQLQMENILENIATVLNMCRVFLSFFP